MNAGLRRFWIFFRQLELSTHSSPNFVRAQLSFTSFLYLFPLPLSFTSFLYLCPLPLSFTSVLYLCPLPLSFTSVLYRPIVNQREANQMVLFMIFRSAARELLSLSPEVVPDFFRLKLEATDEVLLRM